jgi:hypothetical protein
MKTKRVTEKVESEIALARRLSECASIAKYDEGEHKEAWALAHALYDMEASSKTIQELVAKLSHEVTNEDEIKDLLLDVGEELRQILWHVSHLRFFGYLTEAGEPARQQPPGE